MSEDSNGEHEDGREDESVVLHPTDPFRNAYHALVDELSRVGEELAQRLDEAGRTYEGDRAGAWRDFASRREEIYGQLEKERPDNTKEERRTSRAARDGLHELDEMRTAMERARDEGRARYLDEVRDARRQAEAAIRSGYATYVRALGAAIAGTGDQVMDLATLTAVGESMVAAARRTSAALAAARTRG